MNTGQMLLSIGALLLLSLTVLRVNNTILSSDSVMNESKFGVLATSLATSIIEKANKKAFDEKTVEDIVTNVTELTALDKLGKSLTEIAPDSCDDFDDFHGYTENITNLPSAEFTISCEVVYVNPNNLNGKANTQTWNKKLVVTVTNPYSTDTLRLSTIYSYWKFR
jgi:hypothetical protein